MLRNKTENGYKGYGSAREDVRVLYMSRKTELKKSLF